jgi:hypothetical protein
VRLLVVGDYHAEPSDLDDCRRLADFIVKIATENQAVVLLMGDQYHTHAIIHAEVQLFWILFYQKLKDANIPSISLIGNHDRPGSAHSKATAMLAHQHHTRVVHQPTGFLETHPLWMFVPYMDDPEEFVKVCNKSPMVHTVFCHQTFNGAAYDNGFYDKHGVDPNLIPQKQVISGHIHKPQEFSKVWYVGAPRWRTLSDANTERAIWLIDFNPDGTIAKRTPFDTGTVCRKICTFDDCETGGDLPPKYLDPAHEWRVDIYGSAEWIDKRSALYRAMGCKVRTFRTELQQPKVKESDGVVVAFQKWVEDYRPQHGTDKEDLKQILSERVEFGK